MPLQTPTKTFTAEIEMARALYGSGSYNDALKVVESILARRDIDPVTKFAACQLKACVHSQRGEWAESLDTLQTVALLVDDLPADLRGKYFGQRALAHRNLNDVGTALIDYEQARDAAQQADDQLTIANIRNNIAKIYSDAGRVDEAIIEVDAAIKTATRLSDDISLGRFFDMKAQIFVASGRYSEALAYSQKAVNLLTDHPAGDEARSTHGLAMIGVGTSYLDEPKTVEQFRLRHDAAKILDVELSVALLEVALKKANGHVLGAARLLHVSHSAVIKLIKKHGLERVPKRRRNKPLIAK